MRSFREFHIRRASVKTAHGHLLEEVTFRQVIDSQGKSGARKSGIKKKTPSDKAIGRA
jgi:hypothetical protein